MTQAYGVGGNEDSGMAPRRPGDERALGTIVSDLWEKAESLLRQEMKLGLTEAEEKVSALKVELKGDVEKLKVELIAKAIGGATVFIGALAVVAALILLLATAIEPWLAALIVGLVVGIGGVLLLKREVKLPDAPNVKDMIPQRTVRSVKADVNSIQEASRDATS